MSKKCFERNRFFLKGTIRKQIDFSKTDQNRSLPAPPLSKACSAEAVRIELPEGPAALSHLGRMSTGEAILRRKSVRYYSEAAISLIKLACLLWATRGDSHRFYTNVFHGNRLRLLLLLGHQVSHCSTMRSNRSWTSSPTFFST